jgi:ABC-2 type transport system ATP-binding protein
MNSRAPAIRITGLSVSRGSREVLHDVSLTVEPGTLVGLLGPSGCGKTTLMRSVMGVQMRVTGRVEVLGSPAGHASQRRRIGYSSQGTSIFSDLTVRQNLSYFGRVLGVDARRVDSVLDQTQLLPQADQLASTLSGGQWTRVSLAVALLGTPDLLVLDEPTVGLDPVLRVQLWSLFRQLVHNGTTLLVSSHVMDEAARCDRLILMREGRILADQTPMSLLQDTGTKDVEAAFLEIISQAGEVSA